MDESVAQQRLERWSRGHALLSSCALALTLLLGRAWPLAAAACASFAILVVRSSRQWTPQGRFGAANALTTLRLLLVLALAAALPEAAGWWLGLLVVTELLLDGVDGWLARRYGTSSAFGAHFDMEVDACLVLTTSALLWLSARCGAWILTAGMLRYAYVLCCALWPPRGGVMPRTLLGRSAFALLVVGHALGFLLPGLAGQLAAALGTLAVSLSFGRSFLYGYRSSAKSLADS